MPRGCRGNLQVTRVAACRDSFGGRGRWTLIVSAVCCSAWSGTNVASPLQLVGCSEREVAALEASYGLRLPEALAITAGHGAQVGSVVHLRPHGGLLPLCAGDDRRAAGDVGRVQRRGRHGPPAEFEFPADALLIAGRLGDQFEFIRCHGPDTSPVWYFNKWEWQVRSPTRRCWRGWRRGAGRPSGPSPAGTSTCSPRALPREQGTPNRSHGHRTGVETKTRVRAEGDVLRSTTFPVVRVKDTTRTVVLRRCHRGAIILRAD